MDAMLSKEIIVLVAVILATAATKIIQTFRGRGQKNHESATIRNSDKLTAIQESLLEFKSGTEAWMQGNSNTHVQALLHSLIAKTDAQAEASDEITRQLGKLARVITDLNDMHKDSDSKFSTVHVLELLSEMDKEFTKLLNIISNNIREDLTDVKLLVKQSG